MLTVKHKRSAHNSCMVMHKRASFGTTLHIVKHKRKSKISIRFVRGRTKDSASLVYIRPVVCIMQVVYIMHVEYIMQVVYNMQVVCITQVVCTRGYNFRDCSIRQELP